MPLDPKDDLKRLESYLPAIVAAADGAGIRRSVLAAVALRESRAGWALTPPGTHLGFGDNFHGFGLFQADDRTKQALMHSGELLTVEGQARSAAGEIAANRRIFRAVFPAISDELLERASIAAYNARLGAVVGQVVAGADVDAVTTKGSSGLPDYSRDVLARAARLEARDPVMFPPRAG